MTTQLPGFIDLQVNGFLGIDFSAPDLTGETFLEACHALLDTGASAFLPTLITSPEDLYERNLGLIAEVVEKEKLSDRIPGIHLEGPFLSGKPGAVGAHNPEWVKTPDLKLAERLLHWGKGQVRLLTIAGELAGAEELARFATHRGVAVSLGHTLAGEEEMDRLAKAGATALTHLGNALPNLLPRHENPIWAGLANDRLTAMMIADGHHLPPSLLKTIIRAKGIEKVIVVSDASSIAGLPPGHYQAHGNEVILEANGRIYNPRKECLVGSSATMLQCMNHLASLNILTLEELLRAGFHNPLKLIGINPKALRPERRLLFNEESYSFSLLPL